TIKISDITNARNIKNLIALSHMNPAESLIKKLNPVKSSEKLFLLHTARGGAEVYMALAAQLQCAVYGVESYNLYSETPITDANELIELYAHKIMAHIHSTDHIYLGGWSLGGLLAYQIADRIQKKCALQGVILLDARHPNIFKQLPDVSGHIDWE